jgi:hypothetical protein
MKKIISTLLIILSFNIFAVTEKIYYDSSIKLLERMNIEFSTKYATYVKFIKENEIFISATVISSYDTFRFPAKEIYITKDLNVLIVWYAPNETDGFNDGDDGYFKKIYFIKNMNDEIKNKIKLEDLISEINNLNLSSEKTKLYSDDFKYFKDRRDIGRQYKNIGITTTGPYVYQTNSDIHIKFILNDDVEIIGSKIYKITIYNQKKELVFFLSENQEAYIANKTFERLTQFLNILDYYSNIEIKRINRINLLRK